MCDTLYNNINVNMKRKREDDEHEETGRHGWEVDRENREEHTEAEAEQREIEEELTTEQVMKEPSNESDEQRMEEPSNESDEQRMEESSDEESYYGEMSPWEVEDQSEEERLMEDRLTRPSNEMREDIGRLTSLLGDDSGAYDNYDKRRAHRDRNRLQDKLDELEEQELNAPNQMPSPPSSNASDDNVSETILPSIEGPSDTNQPSNENPSRSNNSGSIVDDYGDLSQEPMDYGWGED